MKYSEINRLVILRIHCRFFFLILQVYTFKALNPILKFWLEGLFPNDYKSGVIVAKLVFRLIIYKPFVIGLIVKLAKVFVIKSASGGNVIEV